MSPREQQPPVADSSGGGEPTLERTIGWAQMAFYGLGGMLGAGIYGLVGRPRARWGMPSGSPSR
jgi:hypothetical protein